MNKAQQKLKQEKDFGKKVEKHVEKALGQFLDNGGSILFTMGAQDYLEMQGMTNSVSRTHTYF